MRRSELNEVFNKFKTAHARLSSLSVGDSGDEDEFQLAKDDFNALLSQLSEHLELFDQEQKDFILSSSSLAFQHRLKVRARSLSQSRSRSPSASRPSAEASTSSISSEPSFSSLSSTQPLEMDSAAEKNAEKSAGKSGASDVSGDEVAKKMSLLELQFEAEEAVEAFEDDQQMLQDERRKLEDERRKLEDERRLIEQKHRQKRREILRKATSHGVDADQLTETLLPMEKPPPPPRAPTVGAGGGASLATDAASSSSSSTGDHLVQLLGSQRLKNSKPCESERFGTGAAEYAVFITKFRSEVMDVVGVTDSERFVSLQERTKDEAKRIVNNFVYLEDKSVALKKALSSLKFYFEKKTGSSQAKLAAVVEGKEVNPNSIEQVKALLQDIEEMAAFSRAMKESSFLDLEATVLSIVKKRFGTNMKKKFSQVSRKAQADGEKVNVDFIISFLQEWFQSLNHTFGMSALLEAKPSAA